MIAPAHFASTFPLIFPSSFLLPNRTQRAFSSSGAVRAVDSDSASATAAEREVKVMETHIPVEVQEQRVTPLLQSVLVLACLAITPALKQIPTSVLWGESGFNALSFRFGMRSSAAL